MIEKIEKKRKIPFTLISNCCGLWSGSARAARPPTQRRVGRFGVVGGGEASRKRLLDSDHSPAVTTRPNQYVSLSFLPFLYFFVFLSAHISSDSINRRGKISIRNGHRARLSRKKKRFTFVMKASHQEYWYRLRELKTEPGGDFYLLTEILWWPTQSICYHFYFSSLPFFPFQMQIFSFPSRDGETRKRR
jgi:hypothetical protein